jgi:hypothetical protein
MSENLGCSAPQTSCWSRRLRPDSVNRRLEGVLSEQTEALASGALILVEDIRYRIRRLPIR